MQKDRIVTEISSVLINKNNVNIPIKVKNIEKDRNLFKRWYYYNNRKWLFRHWINRYNKRLVCQFLGEQ